MVQLARPAVDVPAQRLLDTSPISSSRSLLLWKSLLEGRAGISAIGSTGELLEATLVPRSSAPLTSLQRSALGGVVRALSYKELSSESGVPAWRARSALVSGLARLGIPSRPQAIWLGMALTGQTRVQPMIYEPACNGLAPAGCFLRGGVTLRVCLREDLRLTTIQRVIAVAVLSGKSDAAMAAARGASVRTIANQMRSLGAKLGVRGRLEIARALVGDTAGVRFVD